MNALSVMSVMSAEYVVFAKSASALSAPVVLARQVAVAAASSRFPVAPGQLQTDCVLARQEIELVYGAP